MTPAEIDALPAGRELDALVAEKVMGWTSISGIPQATISGYHVFWSGYPPNRGKRQEDKKTKPPCYSTEIAAAWEVVEKLWAQCTTGFHGGTYRFQLHREDWANRWGCEFATDPEGDWKTHKTAIAETAPLAICRAALKAVAQ